ncbi:hypothetical protein C5470_01260 [Photorhabdus stackebrandtii]|uniref:Uncharacterized protein n=1 Tax=Photorhabdus stackebrandtii TaxID=1123042 RepID=A0A7X5QIX1_9GAMM|nr:hypothetical protein [Photorhabdus stackebrandtii]
MVTHYLYSFLSTLYLVSAAKEPYLRALIGAEKLKDMQDLLAVGFIDLTMLSCGVLFVLAAFITYLSFPKQIKDQVSYVVSKSRFGFLKSLRIVLASKPLLRLTGITMGTNFIEGVMVVERRL